MGRPKGSKNVVTDQDEADIDQDPILVDEDLLHEPKPKAKKKVLLGYHPITGAEVWQ